MLYGSDFVSCEIPGDIICYSDFVVYVFENYNGNAFLTSRIIVFITTD